MAEQTALKSVALVGMVGARRVLVWLHACVIHSVRHTVGAVKVGNTEDIGGTALGSAVESAAGKVKLTLNDLSRGSEGDAGEEGDEGGGELHFEGWSGCFEVLVGRGSL